MHIFTLRQFYRRARLRLLRFLSFYFLRFKSTEHIFMVVVAVIIGLIAGFGALGVQGAIALFSKLFWGAWQVELADFAGAATWHRLLVPAFGGLIAGLIVYYIATEAQGHGVPEVMAAIALRNGVIRPRVVLAKLLSASVYIGAGGSVGREGPVIHIGSAIGSAFGQFLQVNSQRMKTFVACGAAGGIAAAFNAPVAGALFSVEVILGDFGVPQFSPIVISSVIATVVSSSMRGSFPTFDVPKFEMLTFYELLLYVVLGLITGAMAVLFINTLAKTEAYFERVRLPIYVKTVLGGLAVGAIGLAIPQVYGVGYDSVHAALTGALPWQWLLLLVFVKLFATAICLGSGGSGGVLAPSLFLGAMAGGFYGEFIQQFFPGATAASGAYALIGMGASLAAATHAPITAILIIFEMTNDYRVILPLMISCVIATLLSTRLQKESIYTIKLVRRGIDIFKGRDVNVMRSIKVRDVVQRQVQTIPASTPFRSLMKLMLESPQEQIIVHDKLGRLAGVITLSDLRQAMQDEEFLADLVVAHDLLKSDVLTITEADSLDEAMRLFGREDVSLLPVVSEHDRRRPVGQISRKDAIDAYNKELSRLDMTAELASSLQLLGQAKTLEFVQGYSLAEILCPQAFEGQSLKALNLTAKYDVQVIMIRRRRGRSGWQHVVPNPGDQLLRGDLLVVAGPAERVAKLQQLGEVRA